MVILTGFGISGSLLAASLTSAAMPADRYSALNQSAAQKAEHVDLLR